MKKDFSPRAPDEKDPLMAAKNVYKPHRQCY